MIRPLVRSDIQCSVVVALVFSLATLEARAQCEPQWLPGFGDAGFPLGSGGTDWDYSITSWDPDGEGPSPTRLIATVSGVFFSSPQVPQARPVGYWDGRAWMPLPITAAGNRAMTVFEGNLVMGSQAFTSWAAPGGNATSSVASYNGSRFTSLGDPFPGSTVFGLCVWNGKLVASGGISSAARVAVRENGLWTSLPAFPSPFQDVSYAVTVYNGEIIAAGASAIRRWDGEAWQTIPFPPSSATNVKGLTTWNGRLIAGVVGAAAAVPSVWAWDGANWAALGQGLGNVGDLCIHEGDLHALSNGGSGIAEYRIYRFDGTTWQPLRPWHGTAMGAIAALDGAAITAGQSPVSSTLISPVRAVTDESISQLTSPNLNALTVMDCAAGLFASSTSPQGVFQRVGDAWVAVGSIAAARTLGFFDNQLLAAGGGVSRWDGATWSTLGTATPWACSGCGSTTPLVTALREYNGELYAAGLFTHANGAIAAGIARWNGSVWQAVNGSLGSASGRSLAVHQGSLYVGGFFTAAGGVMANRVARWDGATWSAVGGGLFGGIVYALESHDGALYAGGTFTNLNAADGPAARGLAKWDGVSWTTVVGLGTTSPTTRPSVYALRSIGHVLHVGGDFRYAGSYVSSGLARLSTSCPCPADFNADGFLDPDDLADFITCFFLDVQFPGVCPQADFNADGFRDPDDLADFITTFFLAVQMGC